MKESYREDLASYSGLEPYAGDGNIAGVATTGARAGQVSSSEMRLNSCVDPFRIAGRQHCSLRYGKWRTDTAESQTLCMYGTSKHENREILSAFCAVDPPRSSGRNGQLTSQTGMLS